MEVRWRTYKGPMEDRGRTNEGQMEDIWRSDGINGGYMMAGERLIEEF